MLGASSIRVALGLLLSLAAAPPSRGADAPLDPRASAFKQDGMVDCISNHVYRGLEYKDAEAKCDCVFEIYARRLTPSEMSDVEAMTKKLRVKQPDRDDPTIIAGANALMRVNPELMRSCNIK